MTIKNVKISKISTYHYIRLVYRSILLIIGAVLIFRNMILGRPSMMSMLNERPIFLMILWLIFFVEMIMRFFPSSIESPGSQKQFKKNYTYTGNPDIHIEENHATVMVAFIWIVFNAIFGFLHMAGIFNDDIMLLIASIYSVCDMICILFFCPFQLWFLKNKCCATCRIYNWDYAMMFTPLFFVKNMYAWSLLIIAVLLMARWEITFYLAPERFSEKTNEYLKCKNCKEKLCHHKKRLMKRPLPDMNNLIERVKALKKYKKEK